MKDPASMALPRRPETPHSPSTAALALSAMSRSPVPLRGWTSSLSTSLPTPGQIAIAALACAAVHAVLVSLPPLLLQADVRWLGNEVGEHSLVEVAQSVLLLGCSLAFAWLAWRRPADRRFAVLAAGLFACMLIRENDALLDGIGDGLWQAMVTVVASTCLLHAAYDWRGALRGMARLMVSRAGLVMSIGLVVVLVYSRLLGMGLLWQGLLDEHYLKLIKNAIEESAELLGYVLILAASLAYVGGRLIGQRQPAPALAPNPQE